MRISDWSSDVCSSDLLFVTGQYLSVPSAIGFIAVFGVAMLNGIVLIGFLNELRDKGRSVRDAVIQGTALRLRPVLMTASVAILGLVPMLLSSGVGAETQRPLRSEEHTSELQSLMRISYAVFCLKKKKTQ